jgi:hypothetical protein
MALTAALEEWFRYLELQPAARGIMVQLLTQLTVYKMDKAQQRAASCKRAHTSHPKRNVNELKNATLTAPS